MTPRIELDRKGRIDEVVSDGGGHLERLGKNDWFLNLVNADGSSVAVWISGKVTMFEKRDATAIDNKITPPTD
jgi:hypothetical protein